MNDIDLVENLSRKIQLALSKSLQVLSDTIVVHENRIGWRQFLAPSKDIGTFGTACGLIAYCTINPNDLVTIKKVANCLSDLQMADGSWESPTILPGLGLTTATCYSVIALKKAGVPSNNSTLTKAGAWLCEVISETGGAGNYLGDKKPTLICSALVVRVLGLLNPTLYTTQLGKIFKWLQDNQNPDGGFGSSPSSDSTLHHTAEVLISLSNVKDFILKCDEVIGKAKAFLFQNWQMNQNIYRDVEYVEMEGRRAMLPHTYQTDGLLLQAKLAINPGIYDQKLLDLVEHLVQTQKDGYWIHKTTPEKIPSWAIMECVLGLDKFLGDVKSNSKMVSMEIAVRNFKDRLDLLEESRNSFDSQFEDLLNKFKALYSFYRYRFILGVIYLGSIYLFLRTYYKAVQPYSDVLAMVMAVLLCVIQLKDSLRKR